MPGRRAVSVIFDTWPLAILPYFIPFWLKETYFFLDVLGKEYFANLCPIMIHLNTLHWRSPLKSCKINTNGHEEVNIEHVLLCGVRALMPFVLSWSAYQEHQDAVPGGGAGTDTEPCSCHWNQWTLMKSKIPVTISMKIHANQATATSCVYVFAVGNVVNILWD